MWKIFTALFAFLAAASMLSAQTPQTQSRDEMNLGVQAYKNNRYVSAVEHFKNAVALDPANLDAQLYLASAYMIQWVPGADSPDNAANRDLARQEFQNVLDKDPKNSVALASMASMAYNSAAIATEDEKAAAFAEAKKWNQRRIEVDPKNAEAYYYLGVIGWSQAFTPIQKAKVKAGMRPENPGPLKDSYARAELQAEYATTIEDGIDALKNCLEIDKENEDAMAYMNLLLREKAALEESPEAAQADVAEAEEWSNKSLEMKKLKMSRAPG